MQGTITLSYRQASVAYRSIGRREYCLPEPAAEGSRDQAHGDAARGQKLLQFSQALQIVLKDRGGQRRVCSPFGKHRKKICGIVRAARSNHRHAYRARDSRGQSAVEAAARAVAVHGSQQYFSSTACDSLLGPGDCVAAGGLAAPADKNLPCAAGQSAIGGGVESCDRPVRAFRAAFGVDGEHNGLRAKLVRQFLDQLRAQDCGGIHGKLVGTGAKDTSTLLNRADAAAGGERDGQLFRHSPDGFEKGSPVVARGGDVQDHELVGTVAIVACSELGRVPGIAQVHEPDSFNHAGSVRVQAWDDPPSKAHRQASSRAVFARANSTKLRKTTAPGSPDFSG